MYDDNLTLVFVVFWGFGRGLVGILVILSASFVLEICKFQQNSSGHRMSVFHRKVIF